MEEGLPNITGETLAVKYGYWYPGYASGAFEDKTNSSNNYSAAYGRDAGTMLNNTFDASRCSNIYGNSPTVQPPAMSVKYCIKY